MPGYRRPFPFRDEELYAFRFDLDGDACEDLTFKLRFGAVEHNAQDEHRHVQSFEVRRSAGAFAKQGLDGDIIAAGRTGEMIDAVAGVRVFAGLAPAGSRATELRWHVSVLRRSRTTGSIRKPFSIARTCSSAGMSALSCSKSQPQ